MSMRPHIRRESTERSGTPWTGLTAHAPEATDAPPVEANRTIRDDAEPVDGAASEPVAAGAPSRRPRRKALVAALAASALFHAAALAFFIDHLVRSGMEAETVDAVSVELVLETPPQPAIASAQGAAEPAEETESDTNEDTATFDDPPETAAITDEAEPTFVPPPPNAALLEALASPPEIHGEPDVRVPPPGSAQLDALAEPPPIEAEQNFVPPPPDEAWQEMLAGPPPMPAESAFTPPPPNPAQLQALASPPPVPAEPDAETTPLEDAASPPEVVLPAEAEAPVPTPRPAVEKAKQPARTADSAKPGDARPAPDAKEAAPRERKPSKAVETTRRSQAKSAQAEPGKTGKSAKQKRETVTAAGAAGAVGGGSAGALAQYARSLNGHVQRHLRYPEAAARQRITGVTKLAITIDRSGRLSAARVAAGSGHGILDEEALAVARRAAPYPRPPDGIGRSTFAFTVSLRFRP